MPRVPLVETTLPELTLFLPPPAVRLGTDRCPGGR